MSARSEGHGRRVLFSPTTMMENEKAEEKAADSDVAEPGWVSDRAAVRWLAVLVAYAAVRSATAAASKPFWFDEVCTWIVARQPSVRALWSALEHAADAQGPGLYLIERAASAMLPNQEIALRLPSIFGFCLLTICIFVFVRRSAGSNIALLCSLIPFTTVLFHGYAIEARAYSLVVACIAAALVCYQRAASWRWLGLMAVCLALAESLHYYAVFSFLPIGVAEAARFLRTRKLRIGVWLGLLAGAAPLAIFWPLLAAWRAHYGAHYWAQPSLFAVATAYGTFFEATAQWGVAIAAVLAVAVLGAALASLAGRSEETAASDNIFSEQVLTLALLGLPFAIYAATKIAHGGLADRYMLPAVLGVPLALGYILPKLGRRSVALLAALLIFGVCAREGWFWLAHRGRLTIGAKTDTDSIERLVKTAGHEELPVVVSDVVEYLPVEHYADAYWQGRFVCLVDPEGALVFAGSDTIDKQLLVLETIAPMRVYEYAEFTAQHPVFLVDSVGNGDVFDWWPSRLLHDGYTLDLVASEGARKIYLASPGKSSR